MRTIGMAAEGRGSGLRSGFGGASTALRAPVPLGVLSEDLGDARSLEITDRGDEFARSGFRY